MGSLWKVSSNTLPQVQPSPPPAVRPQLPAIESVKEPTVPLDTEKLHLVWILRYVSPRASTTILRHICTDYLSVSLTLFALLPSVLYTRFDTVHRTWAGIVPHAIPRIGRDSALVWIGGSRVFVCGSEVKSCTGFVLNNGEIELKTRMRGWHKAPGLHYHRPTASVFVFGGVLRNDSSTQIHGVSYSAVSEKMFVNAALWRKLKDMKEPRGMFNPCAHKDLIYLCGGSAATLETYDIRTDCYADLGQLEYPGNILNLCPTAFLDDGILHLLFQNYIARREADKWSFSESAMASSMRCWSQCQPVVYCNKLYTVNIEYQVLVEIDLSAEQITRRVKIE